MTGNGEKNVAIHMRKVLINWLIDSSFDAAMQSCMSRDEMWILGDRPCAVASCHWLCWSARR